MQATYSPEDNKLRLYVGRVPRDEYEKLRAEGWTSTPKQSEAGQGEFAATWNPQRLQTALAYSDAGMIEDEDAGPAERAADRAERFSEYRDKRTDEATGHADRFDAGPQAHGFQNHQRAERSAARHDRIAGHAVDAWSKAEYWTRRTAGVISNALYKSSPDVRMGRIKVLESELRRYEGSGGAWETHYKMRLLYENQMLEAQGGRLAHVEMIAGGWLRGGRRLGSSERRIVKVNKSHVTGRVVSVLVRDNFPSSVNHYGNPFSDGVPKVLYHTIETERMDADSYRAPTPEELANFEAEQKAEKKARKAIAPPTIPLLNPTEEDAERLQALWNERAKARHDAKPGAKYARAFENANVRHLTQAEYSAVSKGSYARAETRELRADGNLAGRVFNMYNAEQDKRDKAEGPAVCSIRITGYDPYSVIVLTDKPQKPLPAAVWTPYKPAPVAELLVLA